MAGLRSASALTVTDAQLNDPQTLYRRWEESQWSPFAIDLARDRELGLTSFRFVTGYLEREGLLPGFVEGYSKIHHDETRHIGYGIWFLRETVRDRPEQADVVRETLPSVAAALTPPDREQETDWDALGANADEIRAFALDGLTRRLDIVGVPLASL